MKNLALGVTLLTEPRRAFDTIAERPRYLFPLLLVLVSSLVVLVWYYCIVDLAWLVDKQMMTDPRTASLTDEQRQAFAMLSRRGTIMTITILGSIFVVVMTRVLEAWWYLLAGKVVNVRRSFRQWFSLACWTSIPQVIAVVPAIVVLLTTSTAQLDPGAMQALSLNELFFHRSMGEPGYSLLSTLNLLHFVGSAMAVIGVHHWSKRSWLFSSIFVMLPPVLIFGIWGYFAMVRG